MKKQNSPEFDNLRREIKDNNIGKFYIFYGEESYLLNSYIDKIKKVILPDDINTIVFEGKACDIKSLTIETESYPFLSARKLIIIKDFDILKPPADAADGFITLFSNLPDYICIIVVCEEFSTAAKNKDIVAVVKKNARIIPFFRQDENALKVWSSKIFAANNKQIGTKELDYLIFVSGGLMFNLISEIKKLSAFAENESISISDIDTIVTKVPDAVIFNLTDAIAEKKMKLALSLLNDLFEMRTNSIMMLSAIARTMRQIYIAKLCEKNGFSIDFFKSVSGISHSFIAQKTIQTACKLNENYLNFALTKIHETDFKLKSTSIDDQRLMEALVLNLL